MSIDENKALCRRCVNLWNERDSNAAGQIYAADFVYHGPPGELKGRDAIKGLWATFLAGFSDMHATIDHLVAEDDTVVMRWTIRGTHTGPFNGIEATGKTITLPIIAEVRIADGALVEAWDSFDQLGLLRQIGAVPVDTTPHTQATGQSTSQRGTK